MKKVILSALLGLLFISAINAQTNYWHNTFWGRLVLSDKITDKLKWEVYLQQRTQNDSAHKADLFKNHQLTSYWVWLHYQLTKDLRVSVTPFCYFNTVTLFPQNGEQGSRGVKEYRWAVQLEQTSKYKYFNFSNRYSLEYRYRDLHQADVFVPNFRARYRAKIDKPIKTGWFKEKSFTLTLYDEIFLEFGSAINPSPAIFNQNRMNAGFSLELVKNVKFSLSYMYIIQERPTGKAFDNVNAVWAILTLDNLFSQCIKKKSETEELKK